MIIKGSDYPFLNGGGEMGRLTREFDWSKTSVGSPDQWPQSLRTTVGILLNSRFPMFLFWGDDLIQFYNDAYRPSLGVDGKHPKALGQRAEDCFPEIWPDIKPLLDQVRSGGGATWAEDQLLPFYRNGRMEDIYWTFSYSPVLDDKGNIGGVLTVCSETTEKVKAVGRLLESEQTLRNTVSQAPVAMFIFRGEAMIIEAANENALAMIRRTDAVVGRPLLEAVPELTGSPAYEVFQEVYRTGIAQYGQEVLVPLEKGGVLEDRYFNFAYTPLTEDGRVVGVMDIATEVTDQVVARKNVEESERSLMNAVELAELGTWHIDLANNRADYPDRVADWFGLPSGSELSALFAAVPADDAARMQQAIAAAILPQSNGEIDIEHAVTNTITGQHRIIHSRGKVVYDEAGNVTGLTGTGRDVTLLRQTQAELELLVQERTEALEATNEELALANTELKRSNEELSQYAYVASHDLQEPLRKIQMFSDRLGADTAMSPRSTGLVSKISASAERMRLLIRDLLDFSRLLKSDLLYRPVDLNEVVRNVYSDFELTAAEKEAKLVADPLPVVEAVALQMNQLFYNLVSNSLKFTRPGVVPEISIASRVLDGAELRNYIPEPWPFATYHQICVRDNGIGFEKQYADQIFEVFKRLHGRDTYPGSGIGLALCRRIVANHGGALHTESTPGQGSAFCLILPDKQTDTPSALPEELKFKE